jgi:hypothetical protein
LLAYIRTSFPQTPPAYIYTLVNQKNDRNSQYTLDTNPENHHIKRKAQFTPQKPPFTNNSLKRPKNSSTCPFDPSIPPLTISTHDNPFENQLADSTKGPFSLVFAPGVTGCDKDG